jgi:hypothetical protein
MGGHEERARKYRLKAAELRAMLPDMKDQNMRATLAGIAAGYDRLAKIQETLAKADKRSGKS